MKKTSLFILLLGLLWSCRKDSEELIITETYYTPPVVRVTGTVAGTVVDENGNGRSGITVSIGNIQQTTGPSGYFKFSDVEMDANGTFIRAHSSQLFFPGSTRIFPLPNSTNYVTIRMLTRSQYHISATQGGTIEMQSGASVTLPAGGMVRPGGQPYNGPMIVWARWIDPVDPNLGEIMPGNLQGISTEDQEVALATYGMMVVELTTHLREPLRLAPGAEAELFFPLPSTLAGSAPAEIPLWHFDENTGLWREDGKAHMQGNGYRGKVSHFSFWNCDVPFPLVTVRGRLVNDRGAPYANILVKVSFSGMAATGHGWTNQDGIFSGKLPANEALILTAFTPCDAEVSMPIGPFSSITDLGNVMLESPSASNITFIGRLLNCAGHPVSQGMLRICWANGSCQSILTDHHGYFNNNVMFCGTVPGISVTGFDLIDDRRSFPIQVTAANEITLGDIETCRTLPAHEFFRITVDGDEYYDTWQGVARQEGDVLEFGIEFPYVIVRVLNNNLMGDFSGNSIGFFFSENRGTAGIYRGSCPLGNCPGFTVIITDFETFPGGFVSGSFEGILDFTQGTEIFPNRVITGEFNLLRRS